MCWSARVSLNTYIVALFGTVFALANGMPFNLIVWLHLFSLMQLVEYFLWKNLHRPDWNTFYSGVGLTILALEPIASMFLMEPGRLRNSILCAYLLFITIIIFLYYPWTPYTKIASNGHLSWLWQPKGISLITNLLWAMFFLVPLLLSKYYIIGLLGTITIIITFITYNKYGSWGSMWCWIANAIWLFVIGYIASDKCFQGLFCKQKHDKMI